MQNVAVVGGMVAGVSGPGAVKKCGVVAFGAGSVAEQVGDLVDLLDFDALRRRERVGVGVLREQDGLLHEVGPDGRGSVCAFDLDV